jgi:large conductance mechanosensitive channel
LEEAAVFKGFKNFLTQGNIVVVAIGLVVALAFSGLVKAFTTSVIDPIVNRAQGSHAIGLGVQLGTAGNAATFVNFGELIAAILYFLIFMAVVYFAIVVPYRRAQARIGNKVFGPPAAVKTCPYCLSGDIPAAATKCKFCASTLAGPSAAPAAPATPVH